MKKKLCLFLSLVMLLSAPASLPAFAEEAKQETEAVTEEKQTEAKEPQTDAPAPEPQTEAKEPQTDAPAPEPQTEAKEPQTDAPAPESETAASETQAPESEAETSIEAEEEQILDIETEEKATEALSEYESETETEKQGEFPKVGDVVNGFEVKQIRPFPAIGAQIALFEHKRTHAQLMYIANDDTNRVFDLTFFTDAIDKTGLPHVFEHSVLDGSDKYPSKTLWFNVAYQTYNTFMNAFTQSRMTSYPVASLSEAQLLKYADYYTDACLHPNVVKDESIFREEAWRYRLESADAPLTIEGTVYSEMLGAIDLEGAANTNTMSVLFPGSTIGNEYGGDPDFIPDMTHESLGNYHSLYYHPSNSIAYLYGQFEDYTLFLKQLDAAYAPYEYREFKHSDPGYTPLEGNVEESFGFPVEQGSGTEDATSIYYAIVCPGADPSQQLILNTLTDLLGDNASLLQQSLQAALPSGSFSPFISLDGPEPAIVFAADNVNKEDAATFKETIDKTLAQIAQEGFPQDLVDGVMATLRIQTLLIRENGSVGVDSIVPDMGYWHSVTGDPFEYLDYIEGMSKMDEWNKQGLYAKAVSDWLLDPKASALVTTYPEPGKKEEKDAALEAKLAEVKAAMSEEEIAALVEATNAEEPEVDNTAAVAAMQAVTVASLPEEIKLYEVSNQVGEDGVHRVDVPAEVDGVGQIDILLDATGVAQDDLHWLELYVDLVGELDTKEHTKAEIASLMSRYFNNGNIHTAILREGENFRPALEAGWVGLDEDLAAGYDLVNELLYEENYEDPQKIGEALASLKAGIKSQFNQAPYNLQIMRARAVTSELYRYYDYVHDLAYYEFLGEVQGMLETDAQSVTDHLTAIAEQMRNRTNASMIYCGSKKSIEINRPLADAFLANLKAEPIERVSYDLPVPARSEALIIDSGVQFNGEAASYEELGLEGFEGGIQAVASLVLDSLLYPQLRDQYGAYSVLHGADEYEGAYIISYRDPNIAQTFDVYSKLQEQFQAMQKDQSVLDGYILSSYAGYAMPQGELSGAVSAAVATLQGEPQDKRLTYMRQLKQVTPETVAKYADLYGKLYSEGVKFTAGPASAVNAEADRYEVILNPFGAVDYSQQGFEDVPEDSEYHDAVMTVLENGLMAPASETTFGVEEPATEGDLIAAMFMMAGGGSLDVDAAIETFAQYGLTDVQPDAAITGTDVDEMFAFLGGDIWQGEGGTEEINRGQLAQYLADFLAVIQEAQNAAA